MSALQNEQFAIKNCEKEKKIPKWESSRPATRIRIKNQRSEPLQQRIEIVDHGRGMLATEKKRGKR